MKKKNDNVLAPFLLIFLVIMVAYFVTPSLGKIDHMLMSNDPTGFAIMIIVVVLGAIVLVMLEEKGGKK